MQRRTGASQLKEEIWNLRQAIQDIKRDLPISDRSERSQSLAKVNESEDPGDFSREEELVSFRPERLRQSLETAQDDHRRSSGTVSKEELIQMDLQVIKDKIDSLKTSLLLSEQKAMKSGGEKQPGREEQEVVRKKEVEGKEEKLRKELEMLQIENKLLKDRLTSRPGKSESTLPKRKSAKPRSRKAKTKKSESPNLCENCAFLRAKGFESDICYRHQMRSNPYLHSKP